MTAHNEASHAKNRQFEEELEALVKKYLAEEDTCRVCMADELEFYTDEIRTVDFERAMDLIAAGLLRSSGRLT